MDSAENQRRVHLCLAILQHDGSTAFDFHLSVFRSHLLYHLDLDNAVSGKILRPIRNQFTDKGKEQCSTRVLESNEIDSRRNESN